MFAGDSSDLITPINICFIGDGAVGKTCLAMRMMNGEFPREYIPTVVDSIPFMFETKKGKKFKFQFLDTAGQSEYDRLR